MDLTIYSFIIALGAIGSFIGSAITLTKVIKTAAAIKVKPEKLYGKEADERYKAMLAKKFDKPFIKFGPDEHRGGNRSMPQFEVEKFTYDPDSMPADWEQYTKTIRYYFEDGDKKMVVGWRM